MAMSEREAKQYGHPRPPRVVVAEDERTLRELLAMNLTAAGFDVRTADNGARALQLVRTTAPDIVVLDIMMPGLDGIEVLDAIRNDSEMRDTKVVVLSARGTDKDIWNGWAAGADCYLTKPCSMNELLSTITRVFVSSAFTR